MCSVLSYTFRRAMPTVPRITATLHHPPHCPILEQHLPRKLQDSALHAAPFLPLRLRRLQNNWTSFASQRSTQSNLLSATVDSFCSSNSAIWPFTPHPDLQSNFFLRSLELLPRPPWQRTQCSATHFDRPCSATVLRTSLQHPPHCHILGQHSPHANLRFSPSCRPLSPLLSPPLMSLKLDLFHFL